MFKIRIVLFLIAMIFSGCIGGYIIIPIIVPIPALAPAYPTVFSSHDKAFMPWYEENLQH